MRGHEQVRGTPAAGPLPAPAALRLIVAASFASARPATPTLGGGRLAQTQPLPGASARPLPGLQMRWRASLFWSSPEERC
eukprot:2708974-Prymnesium_polylepis.1